MTPSYNLVDQPFLPCLMADGPAGELGLRECLARAHEVREVWDGSPLVTAALHRLLLAVLHRVLGPASLTEWKALWAAGRFDSARLDDYWAKWGDRFDLFDAGRPFYQTAGFRTDDPAGVSRLAHEWASGNNPTLFDHTLDADPPAVTPGTAARLLVGLQGWALGGGRSATGYTSHAPLVQGAVVVARGLTLFETLMLNMVAYNAESPLPADDDAPVWERAPTPPSAGPEFPAGYLDYLTWQSRTLALHPEVAGGNVVVRRVSLAQGRRLSPAGVPDPMMAYRRDEQAGERALRLGEDRAVWRDSGALFQTNQQFGRRPASFNWLAQLCAEGVVPRHRRFDLSVFGLNSDQAKVNFWRHDRMPLPTEYLGDVDLVETLRSALSTAEDVADGLREAVRVTAQVALAPGGQADRKRVAALLEELAPERAYWSRLEVPFRRFFVALAEADDPQPAVRGWVCGELAARAREAFDRTAGRLDGIARLLRAVARGRQHLDRRLAAATTPYREEAHEQTV